VNYTLECVECCRSSPFGAFQLRSFIHKCLLTYYPKPKDRKRMLKLANERLVISVTQLPFLSNRLVREYRSCDDVLDYLHATCNVPILCGLPTRDPQNSTRFLIDGGATNFLPVCENTLLTVSVFGPADIRPSIALPARYACYPPRSEEMKRIYELGFHDGHRWLFSHSKATIRSVFAATDPVMNVDELSKLSHLSPSRSQISQSCSSLSSSLHQITQPIQQKKTPLRLLCHSAIEKPAHQQHPARIYCQQFFFTWMDMILLLTSALWLVPFMNFCLFLINANRVLRGQERFSDFLKQITSVRFIIGFLPLLSYIQIRRRPSSQLAVEHSNNRLYHWLSQSKVPI